MLCYQLSVFVERVLGLLQRRLSHSRTPSSTQVSYCCLDRPTRGGLSPSPLRFLARNSCKLSEDQDNCWTMPVYAYASSKDEQEAQLLGQGTATMAAVWLRNWKIMTIIKTILIIEESFVIFQVKKVSILCNETLFSCS